MQSRKRICKIFESTKTFHFRGNAKIESQTMLATMEAGPVRWLCTLPAVRCNARVQMSSIVVGALDFLFLWWCGIPWVVHSSWAHLNLSHHEFWRVASVHVDVEGSIASKLLVTTWMAQGPFSRLRFVCMRKAKDKLGTVKNSKKTLGFSFFL